MIRSQTYARWFPGAAFVLLVALGTPSAALAQSAENKAAARTLGVEGIKLANEGNCEAAVEKLARAEALYHAPTILGRLGECQVNLGKLVEGTENLNRVVRERLPENAPSAFLKARDRAQSVLDQALPKIGKLKIVVEPNVEGLEIRVGDKIVPLALLGAERPTDPGTHQIVAHAPGYRPSTAEITLAEGGAQTVNLTLVADPAQEAPAAPPPEQPPTQASATTAAGPVDAGTQGSDKTLAYVLWGVGGAGLLTGTVTGVMAMGKKGTLDDECNTPSTCPEGQQSTIDSANTLALVSTIGFGIGIAGAAAGTVLFFTGNDSGAAAALPKFTAFGAEARPYVTPEGAGLVGQF